MNAARALIEAVRSHGVTLATDGEQLRLSGARPLPDDVLLRLRAAKPVLIMELRASLPWWRDPEAIRVRFDEIAGQAEYDNGADRDEAERLAFEVLARELRDQHRLTGEAIAKALTAMKGSGDEQLQT